MKKTLALMPLLLVLATGCQLSARRAPLPVSAEDNVTRLLKHPQFQAAAQVAPDFTTDALKTIARLEKEKANAGR